MPLLHDGVMPVILALVALVPVAVAVRVLLASRNKKRDPSTPGWRVVTRQFDRELRTDAMAKEQALGLASRLIYDAVKVVRLDNDAAGTTMTLAEIRAYMEHHTKDG